MIEQLQLEIHPAPSDVERPDGLTYLEDFVDAHEEGAILDRLDRDHADEWLSDLTRRVQHYGFRYDYRARRIDSSMRLGPLPRWLEDLAMRVSQNGGFTAPADQVIINEYQPGQGISRHTDCEPCFGDMIATLSLGSDVAMRFDEIDGYARVDLRLHRRSLAVLSGPARYRWTHSIAPRKSDVFGRERVQRSRRVSLTFRSVILDPSAPPSPSG